MSVDVEFRIEMKWIILMCCFFSVVDPAWGQVGDPILQQMQEDIHQAVSMVRPAVVSIRAKKHSEPIGQAPAMWTESIGSGFVIDSRGFVLTNFHVIEGATTIEAYLWSSRANTVLATIAQADKDLDLAVLKIDAGGPLASVMVGNSDQVEAGDWVLCVGSPFGFDHSVSLGTVSAARRDLTIAGITYKDMIQTDAVINEGNSGGPLIDIKGRVIGVGTAIYAPDGTYTGLGFAIPINRARHFFNRVTGTVTVALQQPVAIEQGKLPISMNKKRPNDVTHQKITDCTVCHLIIEKSVVSTQVTMPHPMIGTCDICHILENVPPVGNPVKVAQVQPTAPPVDNSTTKAPVQPTAAPDLESVDFADFAVKFLPKIILLVLFASILFSMLGVGGGFLYVPILLYCGIDFYTASATSQLMLAAASISAVLVFFRAGLVDLKLVALLEIPTMLGAYAGGLLSGIFNVPSLYVMFALALFAAGYLMLQDEELLMAKRKDRPSSRFYYLGEFRGDVYRVDLLVTIPITLVVGFFGGVLGLAGGWLKVPLMIILIGIPMQVAVACSSLMVPITGLCGFLGHQNAGHFEPRLALTLALIAVIGGQIGARMSIKSNPNLLRVVFAFVMSVVGLWMLTSVLWP